VALALRLKKEISVPVDAKCISPDKFAGMSLGEIGKTELWVGNRKQKLGDFFTVEGTLGKTPREVALRLSGDMSKFRRLGAGMTAGEVEVQGDVGMRTGEKMKGGRISVAGNVGSWAGLEMKGGVIEVKKDAGDYIGGAYRGSTKGMSGGTIIIHGNAGTEVGSYMRKGFIKVGGDVKQFAGIHMRNGVLLVQGSAGERAGAYMTGGKIILCGRTPSILPTFTIDAIKGKAKANGEKITGPFYLFLGDLAEHGNGKLYVSQNENEHLKSYEKLL
jgi:formylmethanofuran dehydrogenase subunit C